MSQIQELLSQQVKILLRNRECDERRLYVRISIEMHTATSPVHKKDMVVRLTDDIDPFFLYNLVVSEEDFQSLKIQQGLLIDFTAFPQKFIDLICLCIQEENKETPRFLLQLSPSNSVLGGSPAQLDVIETNAFKLLTHLSLRLLPANDLEIKAYLATCLRSIKDEKNILQQTLTKTVEDLNQKLLSTQKTLSEKSLELDRVKSERSLQVTALTNQHTAEMASEKEQTQKAHAHLLQQYEHQRKELESSYQRTIQQTQSRLTELESSNKETLEKRYKAESTVRELRTKYQGLEEETQRAQQQIVSLKRENTTLDAECHEKDKELNRLQTRLAVIEQELKDKEQLVLRSNEVLAATQEQKVVLEATAEKRQLQFGKLEVTIKSLSAELLKANNIIKKLQGDMKNLMSKLKLKNAVTVQQEKILAEKEKQIQEEQRQLQEVKQNLRLRQEEFDKLQEQLQQTEQNLMDSKEKLRINENVISWLNRQLNEYQSEGTNPSSLPLKTSVLPSQADNRAPILAARMTYPLPTSYQSKSFIPVAATSNQPSLDAHPPRQGQYNISYPKSNLQCSATQRSSITNKENGNVIGLDLKYLKKREGGAPLQGLNQNVAPFTEHVKPSLLSVTQSKTAPPQSAYFPAHAPFS
ncbi:spindle assembly abnormal protein 6 homolog [Xenopus tropicalis]|uniref:Spindle assembly abnormal protein 6 homolog n=1 Tax=Xenopus tropicalis TaxID=8364 RepID=B1H3H2_XENTR|nr:spindle assembly abnormal protein 6 homolog [Xenopus tropicalis]AAI61394.1 LOC100145631 protein [Xenopus tropicalis]|eukprot:NP_001120503.1 spindle assembly abnormal protein 6 homolog [Xenopus tropicalis]